MSSPGFQVKSSASKKSKKSTSPHNGIGGGTPDLTQGSGSDSGGTPDLTQGSGNGSGGTPDLTLGGGGGGVPPDLAQGGGGGVPLDPAHGGGEGGGSFDPSRGTPAIKVVHGHN
jgi:hypothetical protein